MKENDCEGEGGIEGVKVWGDGREGWRIEREEWREGRKREVGRKEEGMDEGRKWKDHMTCGMLS